MIRKRMSPVCGHVRVTFELPACIWADRIYVAGDFNNWSHMSTPMRQGRDGIWRAAIDLPAGHRYEFRYLIDGKWQTDYHADSSRMTEYGSENSVVDTGILSAEPARELSFGPQLHENAYTPVTPAVAAQAPRRHPLPSHSMTQAAA